VLGIRAAAAVKTVTPMHFTLIDRITDLQPGVSMTALKSLSMAEEYLQDHFPSFPVMPGVLMLEAMFQTGGWLILRSEDFRCTAVQLREARNVKYAGFVQPGHTLTVHAEIVEQEGNLTTVRSQGSVDGDQAVSGRLVIERFNIGDREPERAAWDAYARKDLRRRFELLYKPLTASERKPNSR
jgi:3-hydroxyacyl-[acyl-carrier-protein] dehydratase